MQDHKKEARSQQIEDAAYEVLRDKGYGAASMLSIAKKAKCSNETMYRWYGDKVGLFRALVERNAQQAVTVLNDALDQNVEPLQTLRDLGPVLLSALLDEKAVALNRAAAADTTGELALALAQAGRGTVAPLIEDVIQRAVTTGAISGPADEATEVYLSLLIGDLQIRRVVARMPPLEDAAYQHRAARAVDGLKTLFPA
ncbi:TetR/AcrR family transcriptional regulator [Donghicola sp. C2-DW-16]|uniref:TetR/AcrR family transcriptional regulator n=1 Tax=Donghicola mangrovi TaxID=2729614 RepID=A0ABX2PJY7_9RHOB|nr:TetR/AcrR family transcriptional regulator [Donghicola mangrovi]NVO29416.1 TetR/AcrR family transcriptional regulator [Donghicola mangrovi]